MKRYSIVRLRMQWFVKAKVNKYMSFKRQPLIMSVKLGILVMAQRLNSVFNINFIFAYCRFVYKYLKKNSSAYRKNNQRGTKY